MLVIGNGKVSLTRRSIRQDSVEFEFLVLFHVKVRAFEAL